MVIEDPVDWWAERGFVAGSDEIREAQRLLARLGYPIGTVDGLEGARTRDAVRAFREAARLDPGDTLSSSTLAALREVASELPDSGVDLMSAGSGTSSCGPVPRENLCSGKRATFVRRPLRGSAEPLEEVLCSAGERLVQIDRYSGPDSDERRYVCSAVHTCAFIRYRNVSAYQGLCR